MVTLATRGRHLCVTWVVSSQCLNMVGTVIRTNARRMRARRLRNHKEIATLCEQLSGFYEMREPYFFLVVRLGAKTREDDMFWLRFENRLVPQ